MITEILLFVSNVLAMFFCIWRSHVNFSRPDNVDNVRLGYTYLFLSFIAMLFLAMQIFGQQ